MLRVSVHTGVYPSPLVLSPPSHMVVRVLLLLPLPTHVSRWHWISWPDVAALPLFIPLRAFIDDHGSPFEGTLRPEAAQRQLTAV